MEYIIFFVIALIWYGIKEAGDKKQKLKKAKTAYQVALAKLKSNPNKPDLKQNTLKTGRVYANLCRDEKGNTIFDEVALMNDINAACAAATTTPHVLQHSQPDVEERLKMLDRLLANGMINQVEYQQRKKQILDSL